MNNLIMLVTNTVTLSEAAGGLFDFNATLPLEALQFILLTAVLTSIFYQPIGQFIEKRKTFINGNLADASSKLLKADELCQKYEEQLKVAKIDAQEVIALHERQAKEIVAEEVNQARVDAAILIDQSNKELKVQKEHAIKQLSSEISGLSRDLEAKFVDTSLFFPDTYPVPKAMFQEYLKQRDASESKSL
jgi:F-type H+-transporting ATPase subunit b